MKFKCTRRCILGSVLVALLIVLTAVMRCRFQSETELDQGAPHAHSGSEVNESVVEAFYQTGSLKSRSEVIDGVVHGLSEGWYESGPLQVSEYFVHGRSHGLRTKWYASGNKKSEAEIVDGEIHGTFKRWNEGGALMDIARFSNGIPHGRSLVFYPSGCLKAEVLMTHGEVSRRSLWKDGERKRSAQDSP
jgi:antitoxin component YwqK of YwqJK toxin-antitoxin module